MQNKLCPSHSTCLAHTQPPVPLSWLLASCPEPSGARQALAHPAAPSQLGSVLTKDTGAVLYHKLDATSKMSIPETATAACQGSLLRVTSPLPCCSLVLLFHAVLCTVHGILSTRIKNTHFCFITSDYDQAPGQMDRPPLRPLSHDERCSCFSDGKRNPHKAEDLWFSSRAQRVKSLSLPPNLSAFGL